MEKISIVSEYSEFDKLYASELNLPTTNEDEITVSFVLKTHPRSSSECSTDMCSAHSEQVGMPSDTSGGTDGYMETDSDPKVDIKDLIIADKCCISEPKMVESASNANMPSDLENASVEEFKCRQMPDCCSIEQAENEPQNIKIDCLASPEIGYIRCQQENMTDNDGVLDDMLSPEDNIDIWDIEADSESVSGESFVEVIEDDII